MSRRSGFTLVELVVVVMILGILAAVAVPKIVSTTGNATDNGLKQTLAVIRDAIEMYSSQNAGLLPGADGLEATFKTNVKPYLRGAFPKAPVGINNDQIKFTTTVGTAIFGEAAPTKAWHYNNKDGTFICNYDKLSNDGVTKYDQF